MSHKNEKWLNLRNIHKNLNCGNFTQTCGKCTIIDMAEFTHAFFKLSSNTKIIFTKLFKEFVSHYFSYLITF